MGLHGYEHETMVPGRAGDTAVRTIFKTEDGVMACYGTTKPTDASTGYAPGCEFFETTNGYKYKNLGTKASANFDQSIGLAHIADATVQVLTGSDTVDITKVTADILSAKTAINAILVALETAGITLTS